MPAATYRLTGPDGNTYEVTPPEGTAEADILPTFLAHLSAQQATTGTQDVGVQVPASGSRPARTLAVPAWAQTMAGQATGESVEPPSPAGTTTTTPAGPRRMGLAEAAGKTMASGEQRVEDILGELTRPAQTPGEETVTGALKRSGRALAGLAGSAIPSGNVGQVIGGTQARMRGQSPEDVAKAEERGGMIGAAAPLGASLLARGAMRAFPAARAMTRGGKAIAGAEAENQAARAVQAAQTESREAGGSAVPEIAKSIRSRLSGQVFSAVHDEAGVEVQKALQAYDAEVTGKIANMGASATTTVRLAKDPKVLQGLLAHATPEEADILQRAVEAGKPLSALPWTPTQLAKIGEGAANRTGLFGPMFSRHPILSVAGTIMGEHAGMGILGSHPAAATAMAAGVAILKTFDWLAGTRKGYAMLKWAAQAPTGSLAAQAGLRKLGDFVGGPRQLESPQPVVARALGGPVLPSQTALVGENGPELATSPSPMQITPLQLAQAAPEMVPAQGGGMVPKGSAPAPVPKAPTPPSGAQQGTGLSDKDIERVRKGGAVQIIMGPDGPVVVRP